MGGSPSEREPKVVPLEPRQLGFGEIFYRTRDAVVVGEASAGRIVMWNDAAVNLFGHSEAEALGLLIEDLVPDALKERHRIGLARYSREGRGDLIDSGSPVELPAIRKDGTELWVELSLTPLEPAGLPGRYAMAIVRDISERKSLERDLRQTQTDLSATVAHLERRTQELSLRNELSDLLLTCATTAEASRVISELAQRLFPAESGALYLYAPSRNALERTSAWGTPSAEPTILPDSCWALRSGRPHLVDADHRGPTCDHAAPTGTSYLCVPLVAQGETLGLLHVVAVAGPRESTPIAPARELAVAVAEHLSLALANFRLRETLRNQSIRDPLTDLYNRRYMEESLEREVRRAGRHGLPLAVIAIDIDHFKPFNDAYGHEAGDMLLRALSRFLHSQVRAEDVACRQGGEEFLLLVPYASTQQAYVRAEELRLGVKAITVSPPTAESAQSVTISLGVAAFPEHGTSSDDLLRAADAALYQAKAAGRDRVVVAPPIEPGTE